MAIPVLGALFSAVGRLAVGNAVGRAVTGGAARVATRAYKAVRNFNQGRTAERVLGKGLWKGLGGVTQSEIRQANPGWERAALRAQNQAAMERLVTRLGEYANGFAHSISVAVKGGPGADLRRCYYLACAAAFGRFRNGVSVVLNHEFQTHWDITAKLVQVTVSYTCGGTTGLVNSVTQSVSTTPIDVIQRGPDQLTIGSSWPRFLKSLTGPVNQAAVSDTVMSGGVPIQVGGVPISQIAGAATQVGAKADGRVSWVVDQRVLRVKPLTPITVLAPWAALLRPDPLREEGRKVGIGRFQYTMRVIAPAGQPNAQQFTQGTLAGTVALPDTGRVITTGETDSPLVQPPRPPVDGISRGSLIDITIAALATPGVLADSPLVTAVPVSSTGYYPPGYSDAAADGRVWNPLETLSGLAPVGSLTPVIKSAPRLQE